MPCPKQVEVVSEVRKAAVWKHDRLCNEMKLVLSVLMLMYLLRWNFVSKTNISIGLKTN